MRVCHRGKSAEITKRKKRSCQAPQEGENVNVRNKIPPYPASMEYYKHYLCKTAITMCLNKYKNVKMWLWIVRKAIAANWIMYHIFNYVELHQFKDTFGSIKPLTFSICHFFHWNLLYFSPQIFTTPQLIINKAEAGRRTEQNRRADQYVGFEHHTMNVSCIIYHLEKSSQSSLFSQPDIQSTV